MDYGSVQKENFVNRLKCLQYYCCTFTARMIPAPNRSTPFASYGRLCVTKKIQC